MIEKIEKASKTLELLSSLFLFKPTKEAIKKWKELLSEDAPDPLSKLKDAINEINLNSEQELENLLWEYTRLFIGPYKLPCPPWESVYTSAKKLVMQEAYQAVQDLYKAAGLIIANGNIMPDHIGAELNFLAILGRKIIREKGKRSFYLDVAKRFFHEHLMRWIPQFTLDMERAATSSFYKALAQVTRDFIINEGQSIFSKD